MKQNNSTPTPITSFLVVAGAMLALLFGLPGSARAATLTWDANGASAANPADGSGTWSTGTSRWSNGSTDAVWGAGNSAVIGNGGTAGTITVSGSLSVANITFNPVASGAYTVTSGSIGLTGGAITVNAAAATIASVIGSTAGLTTGGTGTLILAGANTYSGGTTITSGTLQVGNGGTTGSLGSGNIVNNGSLVYSYSTGATVNLPTSSTYSGSGNLSVTAGTINFAGNLAVGGAFTYDSTAQSASATGATSTITAASASLAGYIFTSSNNSNVLTINTSADNGAITLNGITGGVAGVNYDYNHITFNAGTGTITISGASTLNWWGSGATYTLDGQITGSGSIAGAPQGSPGNATLVLNDPGSSTYSGVISGAFNLSNIGAGTQALSGANTYTGSTSVSGGTLKLDFTAAGAPTSNIINNTSNSSALILGGGTLSVVGGSTAANSQQFNGLTLTGSSASVIALTTNATPQNLVLTLGAITHGLGGTVDFTLPSGTPSSSNGITTTPGTGSTILNAGGVAYATMNGGSDWAAMDPTNTFIVPLSTISGGYTASTSGSLAGNADVANGVAATTLAGSDSISSLRFNQPQATTISIGSASTLTTGGILVTGSVGNNLSTISGGTLEGISGAELDIDQYDTANALVISSTIANNTSATAFVKSGPGALTLNGTNTYTGGTILNAGTLNVNSVSALGGTTGAFVINGGTIDNTSGASVTTGNYLQTWNNSFTFKGTNALNLGAGAVTLTTSPTVTVASGTLTVSGAIAGSGLALTKSGTGTLVIGAASTYSGGLTIAAGPVTLSVPGAAGSGTVTLGNSNTGNNNITLTLNGLADSSPFTDAFNVSPLGSGTVTIILTAQNGETRGNMVLNRPTTLESTGATNGGAYFNYNGSGSISGTVGTLTLEALSTTAVYMSGNNSFIGTVVLPQGPVTTFNVNAFGTTNSVVMSGNGTLNASTLAIGDLTGASANTINISAGGLLTIASSNSATFAGVIAGSTGNLTKGGTGTETLTGANTYGGATTINQGTLQIGNGGATGSIANTSGVSGSAGGTLAFDLSNTGTFSQVASTSIGLTQMGGGTLVLTGSNTYTGPTKINAGILQFGNGGATGSIAAGSAISGSNGTTLAFNRNNALAVGSAISGGLGVTQAGVGTTTLSANNSYTGPTAINAGELYVTGTLGNTSITVANNANLGGTGLINGPVTVNGGGAINLVDGAIGTLTLANGLTIGNNSTASILDFEGNAASFDLLNDTAGLSISGSVTINVTAQAGLTPGTYNLIDFGSLTSGSLGSLTLGTTFVSGKNLSLISTGSSEELLVAGAAAYWKGGNGTSWSASPTTNWTSDPAGTTGTSAPTSTMDVYFDASNAGNPSSLLTTSLGANFDVNALNFNSVATGGVTVSDGTYGLTLEAGGITVSPGAGAATISVNSVTLNASQTWVNNSASLLTASSPVTGAAASGTTTLTLSGTGAGNEMLSGAITDGTNGGKLALVVSGANQVTLTASNSYSGGTTITTGTVHVGNGGTAGTLGSGAILDNSTLVFNRSDNPAISNAITDNGTVVFNGSGSPVVSGTIGGSGSLQQATGGTTFLTAANSYSGGTVISSGVLNINADAALGGASSGVTFSGNGALQAGASNISLVSTRGITLNSGVTGTIDTQGNNMTINGVIGGLRIAVEDRHWLIDADGHAHVHRYHHDQPGHTECHDSEFTRWGRPGPRRLEYREQ